MALTIGDNFSYQGAKPLDARLQYATIAEMASKADSTLYDGIIAYCKADGKNYQWKSTNTVDPTLGKWREFESGGSAEGKAESSAIAPVFDDTATYAAGDRVTYEDELYVFNKAHTGAWDAADADKSDVDSEIPDKLTSQQMQEIKDAFVVDSPRNGYPVLFDETGAEHFVGWYKYANGTKKPVYEKLYNTTLPANEQQYALADVSELNIDKITAIKGNLRDNSNVEGAILGIYSIRYWVGIGKLWCRNSGTDCYNAPVKIILQYTKTTDTPQ